MTEERPPTWGRDFDLPPLQVGAGTGRVYIWGHALRLIRARPLLGYGLDTFAYYFPQDHPGKASAFAMREITVDKPHNWYLAIAYGAGLPALLAFMTLLGGHALAHLRLFKRRVIEGQRSIVMASLFIAWYTYLVQALVNDSVIGCAVIFWILFGVGVSLARAELEHAEPRPTPGAPARPEEQGVCLGATGRTEGHPPSGCSAQ